MNTEILGVVVQIALMVILAYPLGKYVNGDEPESVALATQIAMECKFHIKKI